MGSAVGVIDPAQLAMLVRAVAAEDITPQLVILDTLARCFGPGDENSTQDMTRFVAACDEIRSRWRCAVLLIHHSGLSDKTRSRGSSALRAALDAEYRLERTDASLLLTATKMKDAEPPAPPSPPWASAGMPPPMAAAAAKPSSTLASAPASSLPKSAS